MAFKNCLILQLSLYIYALSWFESNYNSNVANKRLSYIFIQKVFGICYRCVYMLSLLIGQNLY